ncbi:hypothetical protein DFH11DRAFT_1612725 [Phellopilus nigrolimitatus]|nr:hypothetical protein DFH11DRAFT_1612725 [Phellopilus nigrolimitatus]
MNPSGPGSNSTLQVIRHSLKNEGPLFIWTCLQPTTILIFLNLKQLKRAADWTRGEKRSPTVAWLIATVGLRFSPVFLGSTMKNTAVQPLLNGVCVYLHGHA